MKQVLLLLLGAILISGCGETETSFDVDPNQVGPVYADTLLGLSFQPPLDFDRADPGFLQRVRRQMLRTPGSGERFFIVPTMIFAPPGSDARCFLSEFPNIGAAVFDAAWKQAYLEEAEGKAGGVELASREVVVGAVTLLEIEIQSPASLNRRYVFQGKDGRFLQFDYLVPADSETELLPRVNSSIGSLLLF